MMIHHGSDQRHTAAEERQSWVSAEFILPYSLTLRFILTIQNMLHVTFQIYTGDVPLSVIISNLVHIT